MLHYSLEFKRGETTSPLNVGRRSSVYLGSTAIFQGEKAGDTEVHDGEGQCWRLSTTGVCVH